ncbi:alcohol oxidase [Sarocladium strictum]
MADGYDFIVVGAGPAGCALAAKLSDAASKPSVLLLEAGSVNDDINQRVDGQRWTTFTNQEMNWGFKTVPQKNLDKRVLDYSRGLGLGGSSAINFGVWSVGSRDEYDEWARLVGDESYGWLAMQRRLKELEEFDPRLPADVSTKYAKPNPADHGSSGKLKIGYAPEFERDLTPMLDVFEDAGLPLNPDHNSGNPLGMSVLINTAQSGLRSTSKDLVTPAPQNLTILTESKVQKLLFDGKRVTGVVCEDKSYTASKDVILSAGSLESPKILMHSGIGEPQELEDFSIPVTAALPAVGKGLRDHVFCPVIHTRAPGSTDRPGFYGNQSAMDDALKQWQKDHTGPWAKFACELGIGWFKLEDLQSRHEFQNLPKSTQDLLLKETVPHYEIISHFPVHWGNPNWPEVHPDYNSLLVFLSQAESRGKVSLQSSDPDVPLLFDPNFLDSALDQRIAIDAMRQVLKLVKSEGYANVTEAQLAGPASDSDEDILNHWRQTGASSWHMTGTVKMGQPGDDDAVVDDKFRVMGGISGLRVADLSVAPVLSSAHTQAAAYLIGATCGDKLIEEYSL